ncbi:CobW family GTP-binding protein [Sunxiuqinia elliptica]|uniref:G3E family GTPase n=1 Tax=Sunxiuqinia elliptica TaxID=655355 RepID=A0A4R6GLI8_9BACT|nr:CobW family GTP-binding protein [Sunxiuqinia elliptica]TDN95903.1 G3E family GTPase [Sunxiuqinia elliptica]TDO67844.1 G3E family GTPase [Sunxiuqinia elliptica]
MSIPLHLVTGFLGSGKTSFLKHFLKSFEGKGKIAVIQNEFSEVNVDGAELRETASYDLLEINNGSVFCVCLLGSFIDSLADFIKEKQPDLILMEASGLSDPIGVGQIFQAQKLRGTVFLEHVWCLVDACNYNRIPALKLRMNHQLRTADTIIVNKVDLAKLKLDEVITQVQEINPFARLLQGEYGKVSLDGLKKALSFYPAEDKGLGRPDIASGVIRSSREISLVRLKQFLQKMKKDCIRTKGFVKIEGGKMVFVQGVFDEFRIEEHRHFVGPAELVMIGNFDRTKNLQIVFDEYVGI